MLVDLAVVTNVTTYLLCVASLFVMLTVEEKDATNRFLSRLLAGLSVIYIFYVFTTFEPVTMTANVLIFFGGMSFGSMRLMSGRVFCHCLTRSFL